MEKKLSVWQGRYLSLGGKLVLINSSLSYIPLYMLSLFFAPVCVLKNGHVQEKDVVARGGIIPESLIW